MRDIQAADGSALLASASVSSPEEELSIEPCSKRIVKRKKRLSGRKKRIETTSMENPTEENTMRQTHRAVVICAALFAGCGWIFFGSATGLSIAAGGTVAALNLLVLSRTVQNLVAGQRSSWALIAVLKFIVLLAVTYGLIASGLVLPLGLAVGFGALPLGILIAGMLSAPSALDSSPLQTGARGSIPETDHA